MSKIPKPFGQTYNPKTNVKLIPHSPPPATAIKVDPTVSFSMPHIQSNCVVPNNPNEDNPNEANFFFTLLFLPNIYLLKLKIH
jgi:hypothetical protein